MRRQHQSKFGGAHSRLPPCMGLSKEENGTRLRPNNGEVIDLRQFDRIAIRASMRLRRGQHFVGMPRINANQ